jgi:hypothetical protein
MEHLGTQPLIKSSHVRETHNQDGAVLLDPLGGKCYPLDSVSTLIWKELGEGRTPAQIAQKIANLYNIPLEQANTDVSEFVQSLLGAQLVHVHHSDAAEPQQRAWLKRVCSKLWTRGNDETRRQ